MQLLNVCTHEYLTECEKFTEVVIRSYQSPQHHWLIERLNCVDILGKLRQKYHMPYMVNFSSPTAQVLQLRYGCCVGGGVYVPVQD